MQNILQNLVGRLLLRALMQKIIIDESVATAVVKVAKCSIYSGCLGAVQTRRAGPAQRGISSEAGALERIRSAAFSSSAGPLLPKYGPAA